MVRIRERYVERSGIDGAIIQVRVRDVEANRVPDGAEVVDSATPLSGWTLRGTEMAKIRETKIQEGGFQAGHLMQRVRQLGKDEEPDPGVTSVPVSDDTPETDWERVPEQ